MQIHELTSKSKIKEGVFDTLKAAATWEPGETFAQAKAKVKNDAGVQAVAKKAQATWQSYERQLQKSVAQQAAKPAPTQAPAQGQQQVQKQTPAPGTRIQTPKGAVNKTPDGQWKTEAGEIITNPTDVAELERRAKQQITLKAQNKQMSPASGIKEAVAGTTSPGGIVIPTGAKTATPLPTAPAAPAASPDRPGAPRQACALQVPM